MFIGGIMGMAQQIFQQMQQQQGGQSAQGAQGGQGGQEAENGPADTFQQSLAHLYGEEQEQEEAD